MNPSKCPSTHNRNFQESTQKQSGAINPKSFSEDERRLYQKVFSPKIKRKPYKKRSVRENSEELVASFYPETKVSYDAMKMKLITTFGRCSRPTILAYLGRPETQQKETVSHLVQYSKSGTTTNKTHTFVHKLPKRRGYVELFGLASLHQDFRTGKVWFRLFHTEQTKIDSPSPLTNPPHESFAQKETMYEVDEEFNEALAYAKHQVSEKLTTKNFSFLNSGSVGVNEKSVLQVKRDVGRDRERERDIKQRKKIEVSESKLSDEEKLLFSALDRSCREAS